MYLVFSNEADAITANNKINQNMGLPKTGVNAKTGNPEPTKAQTIQWSDVGIDKHNNWYIPKPENSYMAGVTGYTEVSNIELQNIE